MTTPITGAELDAMEARAAAATPGPWFTEESERLWSLYAEQTFVAVHPLTGQEIEMSGHPWKIINAPKESREYAEYWPKPEDDIFITNSRTDLPRLAAEVRRLRALVAEHHNVSRTGNVAQLGRVCPVCRALDPETRAALGLDTPPVAGEEVTP